MNIFIDTEENFDKINIHFWGKTKRTLGKVGTEVKLFKPDKGNL